MDCIARFHTNTIHWFSYEYSKKSTKSKKINNIIYCIGLGILLIATYTGYAYAAYELNPIEVALGLTSANEVKNMWGEKNFIYLIPFGYMFLIVGITLIPKYWSYK